MRITESPTAICGSSWGADDRIVFGAIGAGLRRVSAGGGESEELTTLNTERGEAHHLWPSIIPGHDAVLFVISTGADPLSQGELAVLDLGSGDVTPLGLAGVSPRYVDTGHLVYAAEDGSLRAIAFDPSALETIGSQVPIIDNVLVKNSGASGFDVSRDGRLVYIDGVGTSGSGDQRLLVWVDREGNEEPLAADPREYESPRLSPDGRYVALEVGSGAETDIVVYDLERDTPIQITFDSTANVAPNRSPDGQRIIFSSARDGVANIYTKAADGTGQAEPATASDAPLYPSSVSPDGQTVVFMEVTDNVRIGSVPLGAPDQARRLLQSTGEFDAYPSVFFRGLDRAMRVVPYEADTTFTPGVPEELFRAPYLFVQSDRAGRPFDLAPDGRFLMVRLPGQRSTDAPPPAITVVLNWRQELLERVPIP